MGLNYKLLFKYVLFNSSQVFLKYLNRNDKNLNVYITENSLYYISIHIKLSSLFYSTQLSDLFAYELPTNNNPINVKKSKAYFRNGPSVVYNFHSTLFQQRFFIFVATSTAQNIKNHFISWNSLNSITELFLNANWLEREVSELHGIFFSGKKDLRNLMLPYGDSSAPMRKIFPSIGLKEIFYDSANDLLLQSPVSLQF